MPHERFQIVGWSTRHFDSTLGGGEKPDLSDAKEFGPSLDAEAIVVDTDTGASYRCKTQIFLKKLDAWAGSRLDCVRRPQALPLHAGTQTTLSEAGKLADNFGFVQLFKIDQYDATIAFCLSGSDFTSCSSDTPIAPR